MAFAAIKAFILILSWNRFDEAWGLIQCFYTKSYNWRCLRPMARNGGFLAVLIPIGSSRSCGVQGQTVNVKFNDTLVPQTRLGQRALESQTP
jgi:hypothetical protein